MRSISDQSPEHGVEDVGGTIGFGGVLLAREQGHGLVEVAAELDETVGVEVPNGQVILGPVTVLLELLHRIDALVAGVPDVDIRGFGRIGLGGVHAGGVAARGAGAGGARRGQVRAVGIVPGRVFGLRAHVLLFRHDGGAFTNSEEDGATVVGP
jgi:hypothetical protein